MCVGHLIIPKLRERSSAGNRAETILAERQRIKRATIANRRLQHQLQVA
jgi:hypothetical protein